MIRAPQELKDFHFWAASGRPGFMGPRPPASQSSPPLADGGKARRGSFFWQGAQPLIEGGSALSSPAVVWASASPSVRGADPERPAPGTASDGRGLIRPSQREKNRRADRSRPPRRLGAPRARRGVARAPLLRRLARPAEPGANRRLATPRPPRAPGPAGPLVDDLQRREWSALRLALADRPRARGRHALRHRQRRRRGARRRGVAVTNSSRERPRAPPAPPPRDARGSARVATGLPRPSPAAALRSRDAARALRS